MNSDNINPIQYPNQMPNQIPNQMPNPSIPSNPNMIASVPGPDPYEPKKPNMLLVALIASGVAIIGLLIALIVVIMSGKSTNNGSTESNINNTTSKEPETNSNGSNNSGNEKTVSCTAKESGYNFSFKAVVDDDAKQIQSIAYDISVESSAFTGGELDMDSPAVTISFFAAALSQLKNDPNVTYSESGDWQEQGSSSLSFMAKRSKNMSDKLEEMFSTYDGRTSTEIKSMMASSSNNMPMNCTIK